MSLQGIGESINESVTEAKDALCEAREALETLKEAVGAVRGELEELTVVRDAIQSVLDEQPEEIDEDNPDLFQIDVELDGLTDMLGEIMG